MTKNRRTLSVIEIRPVRKTKRGGLGSQSLYPGGESCFQPDAYKKKPLRVLGTGASFSPRPLRPRAMVLVLFASLFLCLMAGLGTCSLAGPVSHRCLSNRAGPVNSSPLVAASCSDFRATDAI